MLIEKQLDTGETTINYAEGEPSGDPIVFIHGIGGRWQAWSQEIGLVSSAWHPFAVDLRGHGKSAHTTAGYLFRDYPRDVIALLEARVDRPAVLVGHSLGGVTAVGVAASRPDLVRAAVLEDPPLWVQQRADGENPSLSVFAAQQALILERLGPEAMAARLAEITPEQDAAAIRSRVACLQTLDPEVYTSAVSGRSGEDFDPDAALRAIECPVLLMQADPARGSALRDGDATRAAGALRDCTLVKFDGVGHGIHRGDPARFRRVLFDFLDTI